MSIEFVLGRTASKRDDIMIEKIGQLVLSDPLQNVLVVVPPQATYITEKQLIDRLRLKGLMGVSVQSPGRIADRVLDDVFGRAVKTVDTAGKSMMMRLLLDRGGDAIPALRKSAKTGDLPLLLAGLVSELKTLDITPEMLLQIRTDNKNTEDKFADIATLYGQYSEMAEGLYDAEDRINMVIDHIPEAQFLKGAHLFIHGFDIYNAQTVRFMKALMQAAEHAVVSFYYADGAQADASVYEICNENRNKFIADAMKSGLATTVVTGDRDISPDILHVEKNLYAHMAATRAAAKDISVMRAAAREQEIAAVAAQIAYLHEKRGMAFCDMAVVCGSAEQYSGLVKQTFDRAGIPCFTGEKRTLAQSALAVFLLTALELSQGKVRKDTLLAHAKTELCGLGRQQAEALSNYAFSHVRDGFAFFRPFQCGENDPAERARRTLATPLEALRARVRGEKTAGGMIAGLRRYLKDVDAERALLAQATAAQKAGMLESAEFLTQAWTQTMRILEQAESILRDAPTTKRQLLMLLKTGMEAQKVGLIPPGADEVAVGEISYIRLPEVRALFVVGANEGILPNYTQSSDLLADYERELMLAQLAGLAFTGNVEKQKLAIQKALTKPSEKLFFSFVDDGKSKPSPILLRIYEMFDGVKETRAAEIAPMLRENAYTLAALGLRSLADGESVALDEAAVAAVLRDGEDPLRLSALERGAQERNAAARLKPATAAALYGEIHGNASRLEKYYECPYKHFMQYGLRADVPQEYTINPVDVGNYAHDILDRLQKEVGGAQCGWQDLPEADFEDLLHSCAGHAREEQEKYTLNKHNENVLRAVEREVFLAARAIRMQAQQGLMKPRESEYWFSQEFEGGVKIDGKIDRIDTAELDGTQYFDIVDYKTGTHDFDLGRFAGGVSLQLVIYIMAVMQLLGEDAAFAGAHYFNIRLPEFAGAPRDITEEYRMSGICGADEDTAKALFGAEGASLYSLRLRMTRDGCFDANAQRRCYGPEEIKTLVAYAQKLVAHAAAEIRGGDAQIRPYRFKGATGCDYCDFSSVCMFDERYAGNVPREVDEQGKEETLQKLAEAEAERQDGQRDSGCGEK